VTDLLPTPNARDFDLLRRSRRNRVWRLVVISALTIVALLFFGLVGTFFFRHQFGEPVYSDELRARLSELGQPWSDRFVQDWGSQRAWLVKHGTSSEAALFNGLSGVVIESLLKSNSAAIPEAELSALGRIFLAIHTAIIRVLFFIIASIRLWLAIGLIALIRGLYSWKPYKKADALGQMGNGRVFYSGAFAALEDVTPEGIPDKLVRGFACPKLSPLQEAKATSLWEVMVKNNVATPTNAALVRVIVGNRDTAPYVASTGEEDRLSQVFNGADFVDNAAAILKAAMDIHADFASGNVSQTEAESHSIDFQDAAVPYPERVATALRMVLTPRMSSVLGAIHADEVATLVLAFESGKVLAHSYEGERWVRRSSFPHLSARAVLHSLIEFPRDYDPEARSRIRRALVYAARRSPFAPIRLPAELDDSAQALRQWAEVLLAAPHELSDTVVELEIFALVRDAHRSWLERFFDRSSATFSLWRSSGFSTRTDLLFLPLSELLGSLKEVVEPAQIDRMRQLLEVLEQTQNRAELAVGEGEGAPPPTFSFERIHPFPPQERINALATLHGLASEDMHNWLILRYVLSSFGWLARRVGDYSVPETDLVFSVFHSNPPLPGANAHGRVGRAGMVPLRGSKMREQFGSGWASYFTAVDRVTIAETEKDYAKLLEGIEERPNLTELETATTNGS
jgi:hypothetical protein